MQKTNIEWVKNPDGSQGYSFNPITGCLNGCEYCYARRLANTRLKNSYLANNVLPTHDEPDHEAHHSDPFYPRFWKDRLRSRNLGFGDYMSGSFQKGIFVCDMSDLFGIGIPEEWTRRVLENISQSWYKEHRFYLLTKQPQNLAKFSPFPDNCWVGVSVTSQTSYEAALKGLSYVGAPVRFMSFEPLLNPIRILGADFKGLLHWVIIGAQTKPTVLPKIEWIQEIVEACDKAGVAVFLKDNLIEMLVLGKADSNLFRHIPGAPSGWGPRQELPI